MNAQVSETMKLLMKPAKLKRGLAKYIDTPASGWKILRHPLVTMVYDEAMNGMINRLHKEGSRRLKEAEKAQDWGACVFIHERPWRLQAFIKYGRKLPPSVAGDLLTEVWRDSEFPHVNRATWLSLFTYYAPLSDIMTSSKKHLPIKPFEVYRGACAEEVTNGPFGLSWTLDRSKAKWFAQRFIRDGQVITREIHPDDVFAYLPQRGESEVVLNPAKVM